MQRKGLRYSSDVTDAEWLVISPHLPQGKRFGRPPKTALRSIIDALLYMARTGCQWRLLPREFPPFTTVQNYFYAWRETGEAAGRAASPSAGAAALGGLDGLVRFACVKRTLRLRERTASKAGARYMWAWSIFSKRSP
jgi:transposase